MEQKNHVGTLSTTNSFEFPEGVYYPKSKGTALEYESIGAKISLSRNLLNNLVIYFRDIGSDGKLPNRKDELYDYLNDFHIKLAVKNPHWPHEMNFGFVYGAFFNAILHGHIDLNGHNVSAHLRAFKHWITGSGVEDNLRMAWLQAHPDKAPKQLTEEVTETQEDREIQAQGYVNFTPEVVKQQIQTLEKIYGTYEKTLAAFPGYENYVHRLYKTREKMKTEGKL